MKIVPDAMLWVSYTTHRNGPRHAALQQAYAQRVRLFTSPYILGEVERVLITVFAKPKRYVALALNAIRRIAEEIELPANGGDYVADDPDDNPIIDTALAAKADYVVTADKVLLALGQVQSVRIIGLEEFLALLPPNE